MMRTRLYVLDFVWAYHKQALKTKIKKFDGKYLIFESFYLQVKPVQSSPYVSSIYGKFLRAPTEVASQKCKINVFKCFLHKE